MTYREQAVHAVLQTWFQALEDGSARYRLPDSTYERPDGKPSWTEEQLAALVKTIDDYVWEQQHWAENTHKKSYSAGPGYERLAPAQRLAFAQDLERAVGGLRRRGWNH